MGTKKWISLLMKLPFWGLQKGPVIQKWVSDAYPVIPGEYVVFGTEPGAIKTSRGAKVDRFPASLPSASGLVKLTKSDPTPPPTTGVGLLVHKGFSK